MTGLRTRVMVGLAVLGGTIGIITSPNFRADGHYVFGDWTEGACFLGFALLVGATCWLQGHGSGAAAVTAWAEAEATEMDEAYAEVKAQRDRLDELLAAARTDVRDAIRVGHQGSDREGLEYLASVLQNGALSIRQYTRAREGLPSDLTYDEVRADALAHNANNDSKG